MIRKKKKGRPGKSWTVSLRRYGKALLSSLPPGAALLFYYYRVKHFFFPPSNLKLHLGCGGVRLKGFINIDHRLTGATDMVSDIGKLPFPEGSAARIECYHVIEHLPHRLVPRMLREWRRVLKTGGELIVECPDFDRTVQEYLEGHEGRIYNVFGLQRFPGDAHLFGYNRKRLRQVLEEAGFQSVEDREPSDYHTREEACLRIECRK